MASGEWRVPLREDRDFSLYDNVALLRSVYGSIFYDMHSLRALRGASVAARRRLFVYSDNPVMFAVTPLFQRRAWRVVQISRH
ncbi:MAG: hypothetical protein KY475_00235 [Planctomycetes bacterium]|nr:hypothetical protein [Planctomycetota bacterium]